MNDVHHTETIGDRLRRWRTEVRGLSLRELRDAVNEHLPPSRRVSLGTVSNYERSGEDGAGPRASFVAALKAAFPELRLEWLLLGRGAPSAGGARALAAATDAPGPAAGEGLGGRVRETYPDLELLSPEASALFLAALIRYATGEPGMDLDEERILELAGDLRWLLLAPLRFWGFADDPGYDRFSAYCVALLHALSLAMADPGRGDPAEAYPGAPNREMRAALEVGFRPGARA